MSTTRKTRKKYFTVEQANATLPLVQRIVRDITDLAHSLRDQHRRLVDRQEGAAPVLESDLDDAVNEIEGAQDAMRRLERELGELQVELKDHLTGLVDFPARLDGREVYLCWRLGEPDVAHWHELDAGVLGRQKLPKVSNR